MLLLSVIILQRGFEELNNWRVWGHLNYDMVIKESASVVAEYPTMSLVPKKQFIFSDGSVVTFEPLILFRTAQGHPNVFDFILGNKAFLYAHLFPALVWAIAAPLQLMDKLRKRSFTVHRWLGRLFFFSAACLGISGMLFYTVLKLGMRLHDAHEPKVLLIPEFAMTMTGPPFLGTAWMSYFYARKRNFVLHRKWVIRHLGVGYGVALVRVYFFLTITLLSALRDVLPLYKGGGRQAALLDCQIFGAGWAAAIMTGVLVAEWRISYENTNAVLKTTSVSTGLVKGKVA